MFRAPKFLAFAVVLVWVACAVPHPCGALPPGPETEKWNEGPVPVRQPGETDAAFEARLDEWIDTYIKRVTWNCYNYAVDVRSTKANGKPVRAQPGKGTKW